MTCSVVDGISRTLVAKAEHVSKTFFAISGSVSRGGLSVKGYSTVKGRCCTEVYCCRTGYTTFTDDKEKNNSNALRQGHWTHFGGR